jgi:dUTP pyrophosphatase
MMAVVDIGSAIPTRAHETDAGLDLYAKEGGWIMPKCHKAFDTGFHCAIPAGYVGMLTSKSGLMLKGITSRGTIDSGYTGSIKAVLFNHSWLPVKINKWQKISQLVIMPIVTPRVKLVDSLDQTERGSNGFGSSGKF